MTGLDMKVVDAAIRAIDRLCMNGHRDDAMIVRDALISIAREASSVKVEAANLKTDVREITSLANAGLALEVANNKLNDEIELYRSREASLTLKAEAAHALLAEAKSENARLAAEVAELSASKRRLREALRRMKDKQ